MFLGPAINFGPVAVQTRPDLVDSTHKDAQKINSWWANGASMNGPFSSAEMGSILFKKRGELAAASKAVDEAAGLVRNGYAKQEELNIKNKRFEILKGQVSVLQKQTDRAVQYEKYNAAQKAKEDAQKIAANKPPEQKVSSVITDQSKGKPISNEAKVSSGEVKSSIKKRLPKKKAPKAVKKKPLARNKLR